MLRILMVLEATGGGTARHVVELATGCQRRGFDVHLACSTRRNRQFGDTLRELEQAGVTVHELDMWREIHPLRDLAAVVRLRRLVVSLSPDVLHLHSSKGGGIGRSAVLGLGPKRPVVVYTPHAYAFLTQPNAVNRELYRWLERAFLFSTDRVIAVSESEGQTARELGAKERVTVIPNGVAAPPESFARSNNGSPILIGWLGRKAWQKDPVTALKTSYLLSDLGVEHEIVLAGEGIDRSCFPESMLRSPHAARVRWRGFVRDTNAFHARIDLFLMTSRSEGLPYSGLDAMAHGRPIVGPDVAGVRDLVEHGVTGLLSPPGDLRALATNAALLVRNDQFRHALGVASRKRVAENFRLETQLDRVSDLYRELVADRIGHLVTDGKDVVEGCFRSSYAE